MDYLDRASLPELDLIYRRIASRGLSRGHFPSRLGHRDRSDSLPFGDRADSTAFKMRGLSGRIKEVVEDGYLDGLSAEEIFDKCVNIVKNRGKTREEAETIVKNTLRSLNL